MVASVKAAPEPRNDAVSRVSTAIAYLESASVLRSGRKRLTCYSPLLVSTQGVIRLRVLIHWGWPVLLQLTIVSVVKAKALSAVREIASSLCLVRGFVWPEPCCYGNQAAVSRLSNHHQRSGMEVIRHAYVPGTYA